MIALKKKEEIQLLMQSGAILASILKSVSQKAAEGISLLDLETYAQDLCARANVRPAFLGYQPEGADHPFPAALCTSLNDVVVHGIPSSYRLKNGDVLKLDMGVVYEGMYTDAAVTVTIGRVNSRVKKLITSTYHALEAAISVCKAGRTMGDIGYVISRQAHKDGFFVLKDLTGHGVGYEVHEDPIIFNYGQKEKGARLVPGMVLALEPMFSLSSEHVIQNNDESYSSADRSITAHFEHTVVITEKKPLVVTRAV
ncbi:MAG: type I methionyl aminopeptidase [Candidatus Pacebacteria bacterium]|nr:type I methionyl aminopeptidase [Candidatus Paceibacterota bacterium]